MSQPLSGKDRYEVVSLPWPNYEDDRKNRTLLDAGAARQRPQSHPHCRRVRGVYQGGYELACQRAESGYRQVMKPGSRRERSGDDNGAPAAVENATESAAGMGKSRLFGLPVPSAEGYVQRRGPMPYCKIPAV